MEERPSTPASELVHSLSEEDYFCLRLAYHVHKDFEIAVLDPGHPPISPTSQANSDCIPCSDTREMSSKSPSDGT